MRQSGDEHPGRRLDMKLVQARIVTDDVARLSGFYARLVEADVPLNDYYIEVPAGPASVGFSKRRFTEYPADQAARSGARAQPREMILDFEVRDADAEYPRIATLGVAWIMPPATQPWGSRSMIFGDPEGNLVNVFSRPGRQRACS
jgi:predicted enzyme related to lactoylglutathione lyase